MCELKLIAEARDGDASARNALITKYDDTLCRAICTVVGRRHAADFRSAGVEGMLYALRKFDASRGASFKTYLYRAVMFAASRDRRRDMTLFACVSERRRRRSISALDVDDVALADACRSQARLEEGTDDSLKWLRRSIAGLCDDLKAVLGLRMAGWTLRRIAATTGWSVAAIRRREQTAIRTLRRAAGMHDGYGPAACAETAL